MNARADKTSPATKLLIALVGVLVAVVCGCIQMSYAARADAYELRRACEVHASRNDERIKNIKEGVTQNSEALKRIEELLRKE